jgi:hypothetical protein
MQPILLDLLQLKRDADALLQQPGMLVLVA